MFCVGIGCFKMFVAFVFGLVNLNPVNHLEMVVC